MVLSLPLLVGGRLRVRPTVAHKRRFAHSGKFQNLFNDRGEIISNLGQSTSFPATKSNSGEIAYISYKYLLYTFDKSAEKIDGRVLVPSPHV